MFNSLTTNVELISFDVAILEPTRVSGCSTGFRLRGSGAHRFSTACCLSGGCHPQKPKREAWQVLRN